MTIALKDKGSTRMIAHRGTSGAAQENTLAAFRAAGARSYYGIETDLHMTKDGRFVTLHDGDLLRVAGSPLVARGSTLRELQAVPLFEKGTGTPSPALRVPSLEEYLAVCREFDKVAVMELKEELSPDSIEGLYRTVLSFAKTEEVIFLSSRAENLRLLRALSPELRLQLIPTEAADWVIPFMLSHRIDLDIHHKALTREMVLLAHGNGLSVNCFTVNTEEDAARVLAMGVDFITSDILE